MGLIMIFETGTLRLAEVWKKRGCGTSWAGLGFERVLGYFLAPSRNSDRG